MWHACQPANLILQRCNAWVVKHVYGESRRPEGCKRGTQRRAALTTADRTSYSGTLSAVLQARMLEVSADMEAADDRNRETERALEEARGEADEYHGHLQQLMDAQRRIAGQLAEREAENEARSRATSGQLQDAGLVITHCEDTPLLSGMLGAE